MLLAEIGFSAPLEKIQSNRGENMDGSLVLKMECLCWSCLRGLRLKEAEHGLSAQATSIISPTDQGMDPVHSGTDLGMDLFHSGTDQGMDLAHGSFFHRQKVAASSSWQRLASFNIAPMWVIC